MAIIERIARRLRRTGRWLQIAPDHRLIGRSGLFDASFYLVETPDAGPAPLFHFCTEGVRAGARPNLYFDPLWYRATYLEGGGSVNPLSHYIRRGEAAGLHPTPAFDPAWYARRYGLAAGVSPLRHYLEHRRSQRFAPNPYFDLDAYLAAHGEEIGPNRDPFAHFLRFGAERGLEPGPGFDAARYRATVMAREASPAGRLMSRWTARERANPLVHHLSALAEAAARERAGRGA